MEGEGTEEEDFGLGEGSKVKVQEQEDTMEAGEDAATMEWKVKGQEGGETSRDGNKDDVEEMDSDEKAPPIQLPPSLVSTIVECLEELKKCIEKAGHTIVSDVINQVHVITLMYCHVQGVLVCRYTEMIIILACTCRSSPTPSPSLPLSSVSLAQRQTTTQHW